MDDKKKLSILFLIIICAAIIIVVLWPILWDNILWPYFWAPIVADAGGESGGITSAYNPVGVNPVVSLKAMMSPYRPMKTTSCETSTRNFSCMYGLFRNPIVTVIDWLRLSA